MAARLPASTRRCSRSLPAARSTPPAAIRSRNNPAQRPDPLIVRALSGARIFYSTRALSGAREGLIADAVRLLGGGAQAFPAVRLVVGVIALEPDRLAHALEG